jgi:BMFP domain-containing protein YqiC
MKYQGGKKMSKLTEQEFKAYLKQIRELTEGPFEEIQKEVERQMKEQGG